MAAWDSVDLDRLVDYRAEYTAVIEKFQITGDNLVGLCPFHRDRQNSFSVDLKTGKWHCFSEDEGGNFVTFWAKFHGYEGDTKRAYKEILEKYGVTPEKKQQPSGKENGPSYAPYSVEQYSFDKRLPVEFLEKTCHASTQKERGGMTCLLMPYFTESKHDLNARNLAVRKRYGAKQFTWRKGSKGNICLYGEWRLPEIRKTGWAVLVEGESDTHSLWYMGIPAIGVPGASMFKPYWTQALQGLKLYIHREPDGGGQTFVDKVLRGLQEGEFTGTPFLWSCASKGVKDPSDLYMAHGQEEAAAEIRSLLKQAEIIDLSQYLTPEAVSGAPINLRQPEGWIYSEKGISSIDPKTHEPTSVCRTPLILTQRLKSLETGDEKMEIAFKRDGQWQSAIYPRSTIFSSRSITALADLGCTVTSENARQVVRFLGALEAENIEIIPKNDATSTFGWKPGRRFLPGHDDGLTLDIDPSQRGMAAAYCKNGTLERWISHMAPHRARNKFRFILAASFAAPLLRIIKQRIFFVYNWGGSKGGKTAALKAALSAWGDPERLMVSFNATQVGLERTAAFYCDLPLGIDERQMAGTKPGELARTIYMIGSGTGKLRGSKGGGLQTTYQWRTVALATGEEPIVTDTTQTGVSTRMLEIYGAPFDNETDAALMHQQSATDCGWAGPAFIGKILQTDEREIVEEYERMQDYVRGISEGKNGAHIAGIAAVALADTMIDQLFFGGTVETSWAAAQSMAADILVNQVEANTADVNENAAQFIVDWVLSNKAYFGTNTVGTCLGFTSDSGNTVYIFPSTLNQALSKAGYSPRKTMKYLAEQGLISFTVDKQTKKKQYSVLKWFGTRNTRFVEFYIGKVAENKDTVDDSEELAEGKSAASMPGWEQQQFVPLEGDDDELPF